MLPPTFHPNSATKLAPNKKPHRNKSVRLWSSGGPSWARTSDPLIMSFLYWIYYLVRKSRIIWVMFNINRGLCFYGEPHERMVFDHETDPMELNNLAEKEEYQELISTLSQELREDWVKDFFKRNNWKYRFFEILYLVCCLNHNQ